MDIKEYNDKKAKGLAEVVRAGGGYALAIRRYDPDDGAELTPEIESVDLASLSDKKAELETEASGYGVLISDIEALENVEEPK